MDSLDLAALLYCILSPVNRMRPRTLWTRKVREDLRRRHGLVPSAIGSLSWRNYPHDNRRKSDGYLDPWIPEPLVLSSRSFAIAMSFELRPEDIPKLPVFTGHVLTMTTLSMSIYISFPISQQPTWKVGGHETSTFWLHLASRVYALGGWE
ncbi:hypothetical protein BDZ97DRAFT_1417817 [Flammula alnicola]|nr:hypothetical protein BDZ97DRAFT_1417817 [Flammula alnicola]